jgi:hypothetical protein
MRAKPRRFTLKPLRDNALIYFHPFSPTIFQQVLNSEGFLLAQSGYRSTMFVPVICGERRIMWRTTIIALSLLIAVCAGNAFADAPTTAPVTNDQSVLYDGLDPDAISPQLRSYFEFWEMVRQDDQEKIEVVLHEPDELV